MAGPADSLDCCRARGGRIVMTQPLRKLHLRVMIALAVLLPAAFVAGLAARRPPAPPNPGVSWSALLGVAK
jgi:hypothetical protein